MILLQAVVRMYASKSMVKSIKYEKDVAAATVIQSKWRAILLARQYNAAVRKIVQMQCFVRRMQASKTLHRLIEERKAVENEMATKISSAWRKFCSQASFRNAVKNIIFCQSLVRRFNASTEVEAKKQECLVAAVTVIQSKVRANVSRQKFIVLKCVTILVQSLARRRATSKCLGELREEWRMRKVEHATKIAAIWRGFSVRSGYIFVLLGRWSLIQQSASLTNPM